MNIRRQNKEYQNLLTLLRDMRKRVGLTQSELASRLGKPQSYVSKYEVGERNLDLLDLRELCQVLNLSLIDLVKKFERLNDET